MGLGTVLVLIIGGAGASIRELINLDSMFKRRPILVFVPNVFLDAFVLVIWSNVWDTNGRADGEMRITCLPDQKIEEV